MKRLGSYLPVLLFFSLLAVACGSGGRSSLPEDEENGTRGNGEPTWQPVNAGYGETDTLWKEELIEAFERGRYDLAFNDSNHVQLVAAKRLGIDPILTLKDAYFTRRPIVKVESGQDFHIDNLTHSMPYLVPEAAALLHEIGRNFNRRVAEKYNDFDNKIRVTSLLRSSYSVKRLTRVNRNAVDSSTHMFGTTFDIAYNGFYIADTTMNAINAGELKKILAEVLLELRLQERCFVKYEKTGSHCFHITVNSPYGRATVRRDTD